MLAEVATSYPVLMTEMTILTALRTTATSALAAEYLAPPCSRTMAMIGNGAQSGFQALAFKAIRAIFPDYPIWRGKEFKYEYTNDVLAIDVINGSPLLREWVDDAGAVPADLDAITVPDEDAWAEARKPYLLY